MYYNKYNNYFSKELDKIVNFSFSDIKDYQELLKIIYLIYFNENIFIIIDDNIKYKLNIILTKLIYKNNWFIQQNNELISFIILINNKINFYTKFIIDDKLKKILSNYLIKNKILSEEEVKKSTNVYKLILNYQNNEDIINFFEKYNIFLKNDKYLKINNTIIPNFYLMIKNQNIDHYYEFCHLLFKTYAPLLYYGTVFQEGYEYNITDQDIVFDCGGNMGLFALYCASKGATVYCFEPMSYIRDFLYESQKLYPNLIHIIPYGVSNVNNINYFYQTKNPGASNNSNLSEMEYTSTRLYKEICQLISLDEFSKKTNIIPTFIKADIEGSENEMLIGAKNILKKYKPILHICLNHKNLDQFIIPATIQQFNKNYSFYTFIEGDINSKFILGK